MLSQPALRVPAGLLVIPQDPRELIGSLRSLRCTGWLSIVEGGVWHSGIVRVLELTKLSGLLLCYLLIVGFGQSICLMSICTHINMYFSTDFLKWNQFTLFWEWLETLVSLAFYYQNIQGSNNDFMIVHVYS